MNDRIIKTEYSEVMQKSFIDYAMSVIVSRALPDVRDGLKPVQRRVLYDMYELGIRSDRPYRKSARIVGDTMGKYHPHGDSSIYEALVVMAQEFKKGVPLIDGHGNFGNIEGDGAAAMRYTEARLQKITQEAFLEDLERADDADGQVVENNGRKLGHRDLAELLPGVGPVQGSRFVVVLGDTLQPCQIAADQGFRRQARTFLYLSEKGPRLQHERLHEIHHEFRMFHGKLHVVQ